MGNKDSKPTTSLSDWQKVDTDNGIEIYKNKKTDELAEMRTITIDPHYDLNDQLKIYHMRQHNRDSLVRACGTETINKKKSTQGLCSSSKKINVLTEKMPYRLAQLPQLTFPESLLFLRQCLRGYGKVYKNYGPIHVTSSLIGINDFGEVKCWVNENWAHNHPTHELPTLQSTKLEDLSKEEYLAYGARYRDQTQMVHNIVAVIEQKCQQGRFPKAFAEEVELHAGTFKKLELYVEDFIAYNGIFVPPKINYQTVFVSKYQTRLAEQHEMGQQQMNNKAGQEQIGYGGQYGGQQSGGYSVEQNTHNIGYSQQQQGTHSGQSQVGLTSSQTQVQQQYSSSNYKPSSYTITNKITTSYGQGSNIYGQNSTYGQGGNIYSNKQYSGWQPTTHISQSNYKPATTPTTGQYQLNSEGVVSGLSNVGGTNKWGVSSTSHNNEGGYKFGSSYGYGQSGTKKYFDSYASGSGVGQGGYSRTGQGSYSGTGKGTYSGIGQDGYVTTGQGTSYGVGNTYISSYQQHSNLSSQQQNKDLNEQQENRQISYEQFRKTADSSKLIDGLTGQPIGDALNNKYSSYGGIGTYSTNIRSIGNYNSNVGTFGNNPQSGYSQSNYYTSTTPPINTYTTTYKQTHNYKSPQNQQTTTYSFDGHQPQQQQYTTSGYSNILTKYQPSGKTQLYVDNGKYSDVFNKLISSGEGNKQSTTGQQFHESRASKSGSKAQGTSSRMTQQGPVGNLTGVDDNTNRNVLEGLAKMVERSSNEVAESAVKKY